MKVLNEYSKSHHYTPEYILCDLFCPKCGEKSVWQEQSQGDYYVGEDFICVKCGNDFTIQGPCQIDSENKIIMLEQLRLGETFEPSTPKGN